jgi:hypothetical protein
MEVPMTSSLTAWTRRYQTAWWAVLCLLALDYLSTLGYQPSLAYQAGGLLAPLGTIVVVLVTLLGALPIYFYAAGQSPHGGGAAALLERVVPGWVGKLLIVVVLGFTATDFVFTRTFSAAAAAKHLIGNPQPDWQAALEHLARTSGEYGATVENPIGVWVKQHSNKQLAVTVVLLLLSSLVGFLFFRGYTRRVLRLTVAIVLLFLLLNALVIGSGLAYLTAHSDVVAQWWENLLAGQWGGPRAPLRPQTGWSLAAACLWLFPKLALGLSGFELGLVLMPLIRGRPGDDPRHPAGRIRATRLMLVTVALLGAAFLLSSSLVTSLLIPPTAFGDDGSATHRAIAYLAHGGPLATGEPATAMNPVFGLPFGTLYDLSAVMVLCLAGASVSIGLRDLVPPYLHRLGMEQTWSVRIGALLLLFSGIKLAVTFYFHADLNAQRNAYATAVLALMTAAAAACAAHRWQTRPGIPRWRRAPWIFGVLAVGFAVATIVTVIGQPGGARITSYFILAILATSMISRGLRSTELRFEGFDFVDDTSRFLWESLRVMDFPVLVPHRPGRICLAESEAAIRTRHRLPPEMPVVFVEVTLGDPSGFYHRPLLEVMQEEGRFIIRIERCTSIAHVLAEVALDLSKESIPPELHFGWSRESPLTANLHFVLFGHGNVPWMVQYLLTGAEKDERRRPRVFIG